MRTGITWTLVAALATVAAGCGSGSSGTASTSAGHAIQPTGSKICTVHTAKQRRVVAELKRDIEAMRRAAAPVKHQTLMGTPATRKATDRFLTLVDASSLLPVFVRSRLIDHAAAAISGACEQCFEELEADRPVAGGAKLRESC